MVRASTSARKKTTQNKPRRKPAPQKATAQAPPSSTILVVNMVPRSLSGETNQDSEPTIAVNPANPLEMAATAFTPDPMGGALAPVYVSTDGGNTWQLNSIVPSAAGSTSGTSDISIAFASNSGNLYGGILNAGSGDFQTLRTAAFASSTPMTVLAYRPDNDQPFTHAQSNGNADRVYIGNNDFQAKPRTSTVDVTGNGAAGAPVFQSARIEARATSGQDGPQVRPVAHPDGTVYAAFYGWRSQSGSFPGNTLIVTADIVVVRDDAGALDANPFQGLTDPSDSLPGRLVAQGIRTPFHQSGTTTSGQQRLGGTLTIAVDPRAGQSGTVYLAWSDQQSASDFTLHVRRSTDRGVTWSPSDLLTVLDATNAALAINDNGVVGLLYQQLIGPGASRRWETHFRRTSDGQNWDDLRLATTPADIPVKTFDPYLGDYADLVAVGAVFYGIFCANNSPNLANFPFGATYQRNADFTSHTLLALDNTTPVAVSIDPFFFKIED